MQHTLASLTLTFLLILQPAFAITKSPGCGKTLTPGTKTGGTGFSNNLTITSNGLKRSYLLHLPENYAPTRPHGLIFSFHGRGESGEYQEKLSKFSNGNVNPHMLAVYPDGVEKQWQGDPAATTDDVTFTLDMLDQISKQYCMDLEKVYASGKSNGGGFAANILACDPVASAKIAAFAGFAGAYYQNPGGNCDPPTVPIKCNPGRKPVPIFEVHGSADGVIAYNGGSRRNRCLPTLPHFMTEWAKRNGLGSQNSSTVLDSGRVVKYDSTIRPSTADTKTARPSTTSKTASSTQASPICPAANGTTWTTSEKTKFQVLCGYDTTASYYGRPIYDLRSFSKCIAACEDDDDCGHVAYNGVCYLKRGSKGLKKIGSDVNRVAIKLG
ncbi:hypothetical protein PRZ48_002152 [Zasmidium cellare]|uniref:feruloyl esterase n=1 Tax=Zasmidium cellare TaxID=395010 RepID=A0ABR0F385_ZASCE|nr:hypothetical protein PRZ48_002152 [Zasmidium cellare]